MLLVRGVLLWVVVPLSLILWLALWPVLRFHRVRLGQFLGWIDLNLVALIEGTILRPMLPAPFPWTPVRALPEHHAQAWSFRSGGARARRDDCSDEARAAAAAAPTEPSVGCLGFLMCSRIAIDDTTEAALRTLASGVASWATAGGTADALGHGDLFRVGQLIANATSIATRQ